MTCKRDYWAQLDPEGEYKGWDEVPLEDAIGEAEEFRAVWEELGELGGRVELAEHAGRWMRVADHAANLRAACLDYGLGEHLTQRVVAEFLDSAAPRIGDEA